MKCLTDGNGPEIFKLCAHSWIDPTLSKESFQVLFPTFFLTNVKNQIYFSLKISMENTGIHLEMVDVPRPGHQVLGIFFAKSFTRK